jgi:hypothetical protein
VYVLIRALSFAAGPRPHSQTIARQPALARSSPEKGQQPDRHQDQSQRRPRFHRCVLEMPDKQHEAQVRVDHGRQPADLAVPHRDRRHGAASPNRPGETFTSSPPLKPLPDKACAAARKGPNGTSATPAPICPTPGVRCPFFTKARRDFLSFQAAYEVKHELCVRLPGRSEEEVAVSSINLHQQYFGTGFGIRGLDGSAAYSACVGFGLERWARWIHAHAGDDPANWPDPVREAADS